MESEDYSKMFNSFRNAKFTVHYASKLNRKRQIVNKLMDELHNSQLDMIDMAVEQSDMQAAKDVIMYIKAL